MPYYAIVHPVFELRSVRMRQGNYANTATVSQYIVREMQ